MPNKVSEIANPLEDKLGYQLRRASVVMLADLADKLKSLKLRVGQASVLVLIDKNPGITQIQVGKVLGIQRANMVPLTATLVSRKYVERFSTEGRSHALHATKLGQAVAAEVRFAMRKHDMQFLKSWPVGERKLLLNRLARLWK